jgi:hypothetical protein
MAADFNEKCSVCGVIKADSGEATLFAEAGEWLAADVWQDSGDLCRQCLENRGRLAMMYLHDKNR